MTLLRLVSVRGAAYKLTSLSLCCLWLQAESQHCGRVAAWADIECHSDDAPQKSAASLALVQVWQRLVGNGVVVEAESNKTVEVDHRQLDPIGLEEVSDEEMEATKDVDATKSEANPESPAKLLAWKQMGCNSGRDSLSSEDPHADKPAFIFSARQEAAGWIHLSVHATLAEALTSLGFQVQLRFIEDGCDLEKSALGFLNLGVTPLLISTSSHRIMQPKDATCRYGDIVRNLVSKGAYLVMYNSEPLRDAPKIVDHAQGWGAREVWHYSKSIMDLFDEFHASKLEGVKVRYMPAGCADALKFGVLPNAADRDESHLAGLFHWKARPSNKKREFGLAFGDSLHELNSDETICNARGYRDFFAKYPVQLNVHSQWNPDPAAMESVRAALLLTNKVCLLSTHVHESDGMLWQSSVKFGNSSFLRDAFEKLRDNSAAIAECQEEQHKNFCEFFKPSTLIKNAGFTGTEVQFR